MRRWVVKVRRPEVKGERFGWVEKLGSMSTEERRKHSTSSEESKGLPLVVSSADGSHFPAIDDHDQVGRTRRKAQEMLLFLYYLVYIIFRNFREIRSL